MLKRVIDSCNYVAENSKDVKINYDNIESLIDELLVFNNKHYMLSNPFGIMDLEIKDLINFLLLYDSIDFCFWGTPKWKIEYENKEIDGGYALLCVMLNYYNNYKDKIFDVINNTREEELEKIFEGNVKIPLLTERIKILKSVSKIVTEKMDSNFYETIHNLYKDTELFNFIVENFPSFKDERTYNEQTIYFYKLAQLLTSDILHLRNYKEQLEVDYTNLVGCADYKIPQVLRSLNILEYSNELSLLVDNKELIPENNPYEIEIRANTLKVIDYIYNKLDKKIPRIDINDFIWLKGKTLDKDKKPYHLTKTTSY